MRKFFIKRRHKDSGDSELVSLLILLPLVLMLLFTMVDTTIYFANRSQIQSAVRDGARSVAIMGGNGTSSMGTAIEAAYGVPRASACSEIVRTSNVTKKAYKSTSTAIECSVLQKYATNVGLINVTVKNLKCDPIITSEAIGQTTTCKVDWEYGGIPGSSLGFIKTADGKFPMRESTSIGQSESEVRMDSGNLRNR